MLSDEILLFETKDKKITLNVPIENETVWLSQAQMTELFGRDVSVISRHISKIFSEGEVEKESNLHFLQIANADRPVAFNLGIVTMRSLLMDKSKFVMVP